MAIAVILTASCALSSADDVFPVLTVCEALSDLSRYHGQTVIVVGRLSYTEEGSWLDEECGLKVKNGGRAFPPAISTTFAKSELGPPPAKPQELVIDKIVLQRKLQIVKRTTRLKVLRKDHYSDQWAVVFGRLETQLPRVLGPGITTNGFGHQSGAPAQLVWPENGWISLSDR